MGHTPGPWEIGKWSGDSGYIVRDKKEEMIICEANRAVNECESNANLIAAAPDLLSACKVAFETFQMDYPEEHFATNKLKLAIAKAEKRGMA